MICTKETNMTWNKDLEQAKAITNSIILLRQRYVVITPIAPEVECQQEALSPCKWFLGQWIWTHGGSNVFVEPDNEWKVIAWCEMPKIDVQLLPGDSK